MLIETKKKTKHVEPIGYKIIDLTCPLFWMGFYKEYSILLESVQR